MKFYIILLLSFCLKASNGTVKLWRRFTDVDIKTNWDLKRVPCEKDIVYFDSKLSDVSLLSSDFSFREVILPRNGEIILGDNAKIGVPSNSESNCQGQDIQYTAGGSGEWYDPSNWVSETIYILNDKGDTSSIPHTERVPCQYDHVALPINSSFQIALPQSNLQINISSLYFKVNEKFTNENFDEFRQSPTGKAFFKGSNTLNIQEDPCLYNDEICSCSNSKPEVYSKICKNVICKAVQCSDPIEIANHHCCPICGARAIFKINPSKFQMDTQRRVLLTLLKNPSYANVGCYFWKIWGENSASVLCTNRNNDKKAASFVKELSKTLSTDESINDIRILYSSQWKDVQDKEDLALLTIFGILLGILLGIFLLIGALILYRKHRYPDLNFVRFDRDVSKVTMELGTTPHEDLQPESDIPITPGQGSSTVDEKAAPSAPPMTEKRVFKNPLAGLKFKTQFFKPGYTDMTNPIYGMEEHNEN